MANANTNESKDKERESIRYADLPLISKLPKPLMAEAKDLLEQLDALKTQKDWVTKEYDQAAARLGELQAEAKTSGLRFGRWAFAQIDMPGRETLSKELLVEQGVTPAQIKAATKVGKGYVQRNFRVLEGED